MSVWKNIIRKPTLSFDLSDLSNYLFTPVVIPSQMELVRLAIPRRVYTQSLIDYVTKVIIEVFNKRTEIKGLRITEEAPILRHFMSKLKPVE